MYLPASEEATVTQGKSRVQGRYVDGYRVVEIGSGDYSFLVSSVQK